MSNRRTAMNKYIKKCLIVYVSLALILVGMAGVSYAITASDADGYVTRSEFATDMTYLQTKLDEKESSLLGKINKYRSTDIKFITWDSPDKYYEVGTSNRFSGYHTGGNFFPRKKAATSSNYMYSYGLYNNMYQRGTTNYRTDINIYRLWNGNYFICPSLGSKESLSDDSAIEYYDLRTYAVPVEDLPGWYMVMGTFYQEYSYLRLIFSLVKLDASVPMPSNSELLNIYNTSHTIRLKKDLWDYCGDYTPKLTTTPTTITASSTYAYNTNWTGPLCPTWITGNRSGSSGTDSCVWTGVVDKDTGDYILTFNHVRPVSAYYQDIWYDYSGTNCLICRFLPKDNVEYMMGPMSTTSLNYAPSSTSQTSSQMAIPDARYIGTGLQDDPSWEHEIVECVNGIKYWHAVRRAENTRKSTVKTPFGLSFHCSLPIVY